MAIVQLTNVSLAFGDRDVLKEVNFTLDSRSRLALAGANGSGKSTLLKVVAGRLAPDSGELAVPREFRVGYLPQSGIDGSERTVAEEADRAFERLHAIARQKEEIETRLGEVTEESPYVEQLLHRHDELQEALLASDFDRREERIAEVLTGLGFVHADFGKRSRDLSGGWQMRVALAVLLLGAPDLLLLDEPTNYLDLEARTWLEEYLRRLPGGYLLVSHDRYFLDVTVDQVAELWNGRLKSYRGNYSAYETRRAQEIEEIVARYETQQQEIAKTEEFINRFRYNASKAQMVQSRVKQLDKLVRVEIPESMKRVHFSFPEAPHSGKFVLTLEGVAKSYGALPVIADLSLSVRRGEKLVVVGPNGAGKSTFMRIASGRDSAYMGNLSYGSGVKIGYFSQDFEAHLDPSRTVSGEVESVMPTALYPRLRDLLGAFLFRGDDIAKPVAVLSGGEKSRLALLKMLLVPANLLILDEPTNHLDLNSKDVLLEALRDYQGTLIFVSHDRHFIEHLATAVLEFGSHAADGQPVARLFPGDYAYYRWKIGQNDASAAPLPAEAQSAAPQQQLPKAGADRKRLERERAELLTELGTLERHHAELSAEVADPKVYVNGAKVKELTAELARNAERQANLVKRWDAIETALG